MNSGWIPDKEDLRDFSAEEVLGAEVLDWDKGYSVEDEVGPIPHVDQGPTLSCVACATSAYVYVLRHLLGENETYSVRDPYSQIFQPQGGSFIRDAVKLVTVKGIAEEFKVPTPPWTEQHVRSRGDVDSEDKQNALSNVADEYRVITDATNIDNFARAIKQNKGVVFASISRSHCMYAKAFKKVNGVRTIIAHNSYGDGSDITFTSKDFLDGDISNPWILVVKKKMNWEQITKIYLAIFGRLPDDGAKGYVGQSLEFVLDELMKSKEYQADATVLSAIKSKYTVI
jgi:hypothetical protein